MKKIAFTVLALVAAISSATAQEKVSVAAAANLSAVKDQLGSAFAKKYPQYQAEFTFGSSGTLVTQIKNGAPFQVFMSADTGFAQDLVNAKATASQAKVYAVGKLIFLTTKQLDLSKGLAVLAEPSVIHWANCNPETAPYGRAAKEAPDQGGDLRFPSPPSSSWARTSPRRSSSPSPAQTRASSTSPPSIRRTYSPTTRKGLSGSRSTRASTLQSSRLSWSSRRRRTRKPPRPSLTFLSLSRGPSRIRRLRLRQALRDGTLALPGIAQVRGLGHPSSPFTLLSPRLGLRPHEGEVDRLHRSPRLPAPRARADGSRLLSPGLPLAQGSRRRLLPVDLRAPDRVFLRRHRRRRMRIGAAFHADSPQNGYSRREPEPPRGFLHTGQGPARDDPTHRDPEHEGGVLRRHRDDLRARPSASSASSS